MLLQCVKCDAVAEFQRRSSDEKPRGAQAQALLAGWRPQFTVGGELWLCPKHAKTKAVSDAR